MSQRLLILLLFLICIASLPPAYADTAEPVSTSVLTDKPNRGASDQSASLNLTVGLDGSTFSDTYVKGTNAGADLMISGSQNFSPEFSAKLEMITLMYASTASGLYTDEAKPSNGIFLRQGYLSYKPFQVLEVRAGVLSTTFSTLSSLMYPKGFPGVSEGLKFGDPNALQLVLVARQQMPTQVALSNVATNYSGTPTLITNSAMLQGKPVKPVTLSGSLTYFGFNNLSQGSAQDSRFFGNTIVGLGSSNAMYAYDYEGLESAAGIDVQLTREFSLGVRGGGIINVQAPTGNNRGASLTTVGTLTEKSYKLGIDVMYYYNESDTLPAAYTSWDQGNNNRRGLSTGVRVDLTSMKHPLSFYARWVQANTIQASPYQADRNLVLLGMETSYGIF